MGTIKRTCWAWWANVGQSTTITEDGNNVISCAVVRYYESEVSLIQLKASRFTTFTFGYNVLPNENTRYVTDAGWGMGTDLLVLDTGDRPPPADPSVVIEPEVAPEDRIEGYEYPDEGDQKYD